MSLPRPTRRAALLVAAAAPVWLASGTPLGTGLAALVTLGVIAAVVLDLLLLPDRATLEVERRFPSSVGLGDEARGEYEVASLWPRTVRVRVHEALPAGLERADRRADVAPDADDAAGTTAMSPWLALAPGASARAEIRLRGSARGLHALDEVGLEALGPLGLVRRALRYRRAGEVTVIPSMAGVRRYRLQALQQRMRQAGERALRLRGQGSAFAGLREYMVGDDPRRVDWKASARRDTLVTREFTVEQGQTVLIAVDAGRMMTQLAGERSRLEHALSAALVLADVAVRSGDQVGLLVFDDEVRAFVPPGRGGAALRRVRDALVPVQARMVEPDYAAAFRTLAARHRRRSLLVLLTDVIDARASRSLLAHTARSAARHLPLVVALRNDALTRAALPGRGATPAAVFESAAAEELLSARAEALGRMRQSGVAVLDVSPERTTAAVVNRYLELKARAVL